MYFMLFFTLSPTVRDYASEHSGTHWNQPAYVHSFVRSAIFAMVFLWNKQTKKPQQVDGIDLMLYTLMNHTWADERKEGWENVCPCPCQKAYAHDSDMNIFHAPESCMNHAMRDKEIAEILLCRWFHNTHLHFFCSLSLALLSLQNTI